MTNKIDDVLYLINDMVEFEKDMMLKYENLVMLHSIHDNYDEECAELLRKHSYALDVLIGLKRLISKHKE